ncbi:MAG TPA: hypothetical protein VLH75_10740 [Longimicrobiales bacterium]|nr:hypothetical protein [Longimicrobiales bacterium]
MEQLIFVGIIVLFSVLEAVARKGRAKQGEGQGVPLPEEPHQRRPRARPRPEAETHAGTVPHSYDEDPSFDEVTRGDEARMRPAPAAERAEPLGEGSTAAGARTSSEGLIPAEVWEEIQVLARGELPKAQKLPAPSAPVPAPKAPLPRAPESRPAGWPRPSAPRSRPSGQARPSGRAGASTAQPRTGKGLGRASAKEVEAAPLTEGTANHPVHLSHQDYGTAPARRTGIPLAGAARGAPAPSAGLRALLRSGPASLRQAVILQELLGPPPGLREE